MNISYNKLFKLLIDRKIKKCELAQKCNFSNTTLAKLSRNEYVSMDILVRICKELECTFDDILEIIPNENMEANNCGAY